LQRNLKKRQYETQADRQRIALQRATRLRTYAGDERQWDRPQHSSVAHDNDVFDIVF
jgi:hypothetical protein